MAKDIVRAIRGARDQDQRRVAPAHQTSGDLGNYRLESRLGVGGMGEVWRATHRLLSRPAAIKLIRQYPQSGTVREHLARRFQREARVTASLRSPHTVQLYDFGVSDTGSFYYVMELLNGLDLHRLVTQFGPLPAARVVPLLRQACRSLAEAHAQGLVHRDIKPANLFVACLGTEYDHLKVLDFGIVKAQSEPETTIVSGRSVCRGTPAFMAPELALGDHVVDGRADLYSLACVAYWGLTGRQVFQASSPIQMMVQHARSAPLPPSQAGEQPIPADLEQLIMACLAKNPADRPASARVLETALSRVRCEPWTQAAAQQWWESHAPEHVGAAWRA